MGDEIGETYQYVPASPGIGDSAIHPYLTPEYRLLCPSGMTVWLRTARQSKIFTSIWSAMSEQRTLCTAAIPLKASGFCKRYDCIILKIIFFIHGIRLMDINIRPAEVSDVESIFIVRTSVTENHLSHEEMRELGVTESTVSNMIEEGYCAWVATDDDEVVGFSMILREKGSLFGLFVLPVYEGRGIGRRLTTIAEQELFKHHDVAWLETDRNSRAAKFYMQLGWTNETTLDGDFIRLEKQRGS